MPQLFLLVIAQEDAQSIEEEPPSTNYHSVIQI